MHIRIKIAILLVWLARKLHPQPSKLEIEPVEGMEPRQVGIAMSICKKDIKRYKIEHRMKSSRRAKEGLLQECRERNEMSIFVTAKRLINVEVYREGDCTVVESRLNVYVPKEDC